jgi:hypothetical protein
VREEKEHTFYRTRGSLFGISLGYRKHCKKMAVSLCFAPISSHIHLIQFRLMCRRKHEHVADDVGSLLCLRLAPSWLSLRGMGFLLPIPNSPISKSPLGIDSSGPDSSKPHSQEIGVFYARSISHSALYSRHGPVAMSKDLLSRRP